MDINQQTWSIKKLVSKQLLINLNPSWQRGPAWQSMRKVLLIDSILRGMDIPKIYLRKLQPNGTHKYDAVDGQQRLRTIWDFQAGKFSLEYNETLQPIEGNIIQGKAFDQLPDSLRARFNDFKVSIAEIIDSSNDEITDLFSRLQLGVALNPAELRNAMLIPARHIIDSIATSHSFFTSSKIPSSRYKRQDYIAHIFAVVAYNSDKNIKAPDLKQMIAEFSSDDKSFELLEIASKVDSALSVLTVIDSLLNYSLTQKWIFVDLMWLIIQQHANGIEIDTVELASNFRVFEELRRGSTRNPGVLLNKTSNRRQMRENKMLYEYIVAFKAQGALHTNLKARNKSLHYFCI